MENSTKSLGQGARSTWTGLLMSAIQVAVIGFVVLQAKEWFDAGTFDTPATALDAGLIAGATFLLNAILKLTKA
ncbi:hypothetical protein HUU39_26785 [candidate division KSB1 bacterium]|nr:hypothetical protein [bacterium]NUM68830.1 hypothetical protein [candidate division KSB1 bacterium]